jgi:hypothetical protein
MTDGRRGMRDVGRELWVEGVEEVLACLEKLINYTRLPAWTGGEYIREFMMGKKNPGSKEPGKISYRILDIRYQMSEISCQKS